MFKKTIYSVIICFSFFFGISIEANAQKKSNSQWIQLFNGNNLKGWDTYLGPDINDQGKPISGVPIGLNKDPKHVFTVVYIDGKKAIRVSGQNWGALTTLKEYDNFHLRLEFKWGKLQWGPKKLEKKDSGILYFSVGERGADNGNWMRSQEFQIEEGNCGEYWGVAGASEDIESRKIDDALFVYQEFGPLHTFNAQSPNGRHCKKSDDAEYPTGSWNTIDLYCYDGTSVQMVNEKIMMILKNSRQIVDKDLVPLKKGKIQLQSEGAEIYYRKIQIEPITGIPTNLGGN